MEPYRAALFVGLLLICTAASAWGRDLDDIRYRFTSCGASGHKGPSPSPDQCISNYTGIGSPLIRDEALFSFGRVSYRGAQGFHVLRTGRYNITVAGAAGGRGVCNTEYGRGLVQELQVELSPEYELLILVGQRGIGPCDIFDHSLCQNPPKNINESLNCSYDWYDWVRYNSTQDGETIYPFIGGAGGGGASMVWPRNADSKTFTDLPIAFSGGGGGSAAILLNYSLSVSVLDIDHENSSDEEFYKEFLDAKRQFFDERISSVSYGVQGHRRDPGSVVAGVGGGRTIFPNQAVLGVDGKSLTQESAFAEGGFDCLQQQLEAFDLPYEGMDGGFGGGGGGCGGGGGGGGYTGGPVLEYGNYIPGGGGYSAYVPMLTNDISAARLTTSYWNTGSDGYIEIVLADCGCVYECAVDREADQFECLCPNGTELAPDQSDCFEAATILTRQEVWNFTNPEGLQLTPLSFSNQTFLFSMEASLRVGTETGARVARQSSGGGDGDLCAIVFLGDESQIVLASNPVSDIGTTTTLAEVVKQVEQNNTAFTISDYVEFLDSAVLVTGAILVSTGPCSVENMTISVNASIQEVEADPPDFSSIEINFEDEQEAITALAEIVLQLGVVGPSSTVLKPSDTPSSTDIRGLNDDVIIALVVAAFAVGMILVLLAAILIGFRCHWHHRKQLEIFRYPPSSRRKVYTDSLSTNHAYMNHKIRVGGSLGSSVSYHRYDTLSYSGQGQSRSINTVEIHTPRYGTFVSQSSFDVPVHDFSEYNKQRHANDWEYPRCNLIYMRELGEGQFGKVLLMKAKDIAGYEGIIPVAVKTLASKDSGRVRKFLEEAELMKMFSHANIVSLLGISAESDEDSAPLMILEYMPFGDLKNFLVSHRPTEQDESAINIPHFYRFATDVAKALEFLASNKYVHRDVAARNCLVGSGLQIKIADFGLAREVHNKDYYRIAGRAVLPVRWMAPECLSYGIFTTASDVWSYGVLLWEIVTYGEMPLKGIDAHDVVEGIQNGTLHHPRPENCPDDLYTIMHKCHSHDADQRPTFTEILCYYLETSNPAGEADSLHGQGVD